MITTMSGFVSGLDDLGPRPGLDLLHGLLTDWIARVDVSGIRSELLTWLARGAALNQVTAMARETATHYVWPVHTGHNGCRIVINEFKDPREISDGYATTIHNHRYSFVSLGLAGRYRQVRSEVELFGSQTASFRDLSEDCVTQGTVMTINDNEYHRLIDISSGTLTLLIKCPPTKAYSLSINASTLKVTKHVPVEDRIGQMMAALAESRIPYGQKGEISARSA
jgi:hypothetical protein